MDDEQLSETAVVLDHRQMDDERPSFVEIINALARAAVDAYPYALIQWVAVERQRRWESNLPAIESIPVTPWEMHALQRYDNPFRVEFYLTSRGDFPGSVDMIMGIPLRLVRPGEVVQEVEPWTKHSASR